MKASERKYKIFVSHRAFYFFYCHPSTSYILLKIKNPFLAAHEILQKTNFGLDKRDAEREKRSIDEDSDPYDPDNGKDLLAAYLANVDAYKRQVRSVDDDEEDEDRKS